MKLIWENLIKKVCSVMCFLILCCFCVMFFFCFFAFFLVGFNVWHYVCKLGRVKMFKLLVNVTTNKDLKKYLNMPANTPVEFFFVCVFSVVVTVFITRFECVCVCVCVCDVTNKFDRANHYVYIWQSKMVMHQWWKN